jgi:hypothetical protein
MKLNPKSFRADEPKIQFISLAILVFSLLILFEVPVWLALRSEAYFALQTTLGAFVVCQLLKRKLTLFEFVGLGFAVGSFVSMCLDQFLVATPIKDHSWLIIPAISVAIITSSKRRQLSIDDNKKLDLPILFIGFATLLILTQERYWPLYIAISTLPLALFNAYKNSKPTLRNSSFMRLPLLVLIPLAITYSIQVRPSMWWIKTQDFQFFEALSYSLTHWGSKDQVFMQGHPVLYHWFSYAWMGLATKVTNAPTWLMQTRISPIFVTVSIVYLVISLLHRLGARGWKVVVAVCIFVVLNDFNYESFSMIFSYIWLLSLFYFLLEWCSNPLWRLAFASSFMAAGAFGAKSSNIAVIIFGVGALLLFQLIQKLIRPHMIFAKGAMIALGLAIVYLNLYSNSPYDSTINLGTIGIAQDIFGDVDSLPRMQFILGSFLIFLNLILIYIASVVFFSIDGKLEKLPIIQFTLGSLIATTVALLTSVSYYEQEEYFLHSFVLFGSITVGLLIIDFISEILESTSKRKLLTVLSVTLLFAGLVRLLVTDNNSGEFSAVKLRILNSSSVVVLLFATFGAYVKYRKSISTKNAIMLFVVSSVLVMTITLNGRWLIQQEQFRSEFSASNFSTTMIGDESTQDFLRKAQKIIPREAVVASNYECDVSPCPSWAFGADRVDWTVGGEAMLLSIYLERRMYISGYGFLWQNIALPDFGKERLRKSSEIASDLCIQKNNLQKMDGVQYFILDKYAINHFTMCEFEFSLLSSNRFELFVIK